MKQAEYSFRKPENWGFCSCSDTI